MGMQTTTIAKGTTTQGKGGKGETEAAVESASGSALYGPRGIEYLRKD